MKSSALVLILMSIASVGQVPPAAVPTYHANGRVKWQRGKPVVDVRDYGAVGDGQVATDCSIRRDQAVVTCSTNHFVAGDIGKSVGMWGAGPTVFKSPSHYITALTTKILSYQSATQVTLATNAGNTASPSTHFVWGTNNYTKLGVAREAANVLYPTGYVLFFPPGYYLTPTLAFPCGAIGTFPASPAGGGTYTCTSATRNVTITGASTTSTIIENFKADRGYLGGPTGECGDSFYTCGIIQFGTWSTSDGRNSDAAHWVTGITIHDLTLIDVENGNGNYFNEPGNIALTNASNAEIFNVNMQESSYMCIYGGNEPVSVHDNVAIHCGWGGPAYSATNAALNTVVPNSKIYRNRVYYSAQGVESGAPNQEISNNFFELDDGHGNYPPSAVSPKMCINIGSVNYGMWNVHINGNTCLNWALGPENGSSGGVGNGSGIMSNMLVENNSFINSGPFSLGCGLEGFATGWPSGETTTTIHGTSIFRNNSFRYDKDVTLGTQNVGVVLNSPREKWLIDKIDITFPGQTSSCNMCSGLMMRGSFPAWQPSTTYIQSTRNPGAIQPPMPNGFWYAPTGRSGTCTSGTSAPTFPSVIGNSVSDNTCTWTNTAVKPVHVVSNFHAGFPPGSRNGNWAISNQGLLSSDVQFVSVTNSGDTLSGKGGIGYTVLSWSLTGFPAQSWAFGDDVYPSTLSQIFLGSATAFSSSHRGSITSGTLQVGDYFRANDKVTKITTASGESTGWQVIRGGWHGKTWVQNNSYPYNSLVQAFPDNGHLFAITDAGGCSSGAFQPSWNISSGATTTDNNCHWKESGASAQFLSRPLN